MVFHWTWMLARHHFVNQYKLNKYAIGKPILIKAFCHLNCSNYTNYTSKQFNESNYNQSSEASPTVFNCNAIRTRPSWRQHCRWKHFKKWAKKTLWWKYSVSILKPRQFMASVMFSRDLFLKLIAFFGQFSLAWGEIISSRREIYVFRAPKSQTQSSRIIIEWWIVSHFRICLAIYLSLVNYSNWQENLTITTLKVPQKQNWA